MKRLLIVVLAVVCAAALLWGARAYLGYFHRVQRVTADGAASPSASPSGPPSPSGPASPSASRAPRAAVTARASPPPSRPPADALFDDEFSGPAGAAPSSRWDYDTGYGWDDGRTRQTYTSSRQNSALDGEGHLVITARADASVRGGHTSARLQTAGTPFRRGTEIQIRARTSPVEVGAWPAAWTLGEPESDWPAVGEVDVLENWPSDPVHPSFTPHFAYHTGSSKDGGQYAGVDPTRWHVYQARWTGGRMEFLVDGRPVATEPYAATARATVVLNVAVGYVGGPPAVPWKDFRMEVDYVRVVPAG
ncbi:glycoside hydrolase family 16 protein [Phaeacidiphilus oryzae]|uniref:glycoside hydrolase family 16 protein n=1 Tax=Phaeacidiphilus oryzae TaxID=348818 RepID=UPI000A6975D3|nr:glycoside hydrolase family 16 protein [Phaeacidiphilus oryzae]